MHKIYFFLAVLFLVMQSCQQTEKKVLHAANETPKDTLANGAVVNKTLADLTIENKDNEPSWERINNRIISFQHFAPNGILAARGQNGWVLINTGYLSQEGIAVKEVLDRIENLPVSAMIYTDYLNSGGSSAFKLKDNARIIGPTNADVHANWGEFILNPENPEMTFLEVAQAAHLRGYYLPASGADAPLFPSHKFSNAGRIPVSETVSNEENLELDGINLKVIVHESDLSHQKFSIWLPEDSILYSPILSSVVNFPIGGNYTDHNSMISELRSLRSFPASTLVTGDGKIISGRKAILQFINKDLDKRLLVKQQSLRGLLSGLTEKEVKENIKSAFDQNQISYSEDIIIPGINQVYQKFHAPVYPDLNQDEELLNLMGGSSVWKMAREASDNGNSRLAASLGNWLVNKFPSENQYRDFLAKQLRNLSSETTSPFERNVFLSHAHHLEGKADIPAVIPPIEGSLKVLPGDGILRVISLLGKQDTLPQKDVFLGFIFTDQLNAKKGLHMRGQVIEVVPDPDNYYRQPDSWVTLDRELLAMILFEKIALQDAISGHQMRINQYKSPVFEFFEALESPKIFHRTIYPRP